MIGRFSARDIRLTFFSLTDQALVSLGNFVTQIVLARTLLPHDYGIFAVTFGVMIALNVCHWGLVAYPVSVKAVSCNTDELRSLASHALVLPLRWECRFLRSRSLSHSS